MLRYARTPSLEIGYEEHGERDGWPVVLLHGWPYDVRAYDAVAPRLAEHGARVIVPYLRGYGPTRFVSQAAMRSGQQAAIGCDAIELLDALRIDAALLAGFDWGSRAACVAAALRPERVRGLVSANGYTIQDIATAHEPQEPENERRLWYQHYLQGERGARGLAADRNAFCAYLWKLWSPTWNFDGATFERTAASFANPDFVDVTLHSYRHRLGNAAGDPAYDDVERRLASQPPIEVPTISLDGDADGVIAIGGTAKHAPHFTGRHEHRTLPQIGHALPYEAPDAFARALLTVREWTS